MRLSRPAVMVGCILMMNLVHFGRAYADGFPTPDDIIIWQGGSRWARVQADDPRRGALMEATKLLFAGVDGVRKTPASGEEIGKLKEKGAVLELRYTPPVTMASLLPAGSRLLSAHGKREVSSVLLPSYEDYHGFPNIVASGLVWGSRVPKEAGKALHAAIAEFLVNESLPEPAEVIAWTGKGRSVRVARDDPWRDDLLRTATLLLAGVDAVCRGNASDADWEWVRQTGAVLELKYHPPVKLGSLLPPDSRLQNAGCENEEVTSLLLPCYLPYFGFPRVMANCLILKSSVKEDVPGYLTDYIGLFRSDQPQPPSP